MARSSCFPPSRSTGSAPERWGPTRSEAEAAPVGRLTAGLEALERAYSSGHHGRWSARRRSGLVDDAVRAIGETHLDGRIALVALGGYGRSLLTPGSDIDLMVLHAERRDAPVRAAAESVFYPFWDAGLKLGHAVRTVRQCVELSRQRLDAATAHLDARLVWGSDGLFESLRRGVSRAVDRDRMLDWLREDTASRHERFGSCSQLLEPDLKESVGGLRDVHAVGWVARALGLASVRELVAEGPLRAAEAAALDDAEEFLVRLRSALHLEGGRRDTLFLEDQPPLARAFGFEATAGLDAPDALMRALFAHARQVEHIRASLMDRVAGSPQAETGPRGDDPGGMLVAFAEHAAAASTPPPEVLDAAESGSGAIEWTPAMYAALTQLLASPGATGALEAMDRVGFLPRLLPEWEAVRCRPQRDPYHRFTVDVHLVRAVEHAAAILGGRTGEDAVLAAAAETVTDRDAVLLGALLHDIGKRGAGPHVPVGVEVATEVLERIGAPPETADHVGFLVAEHLLLSDTATRRDLSDENLIIDVAARVGDPERLAMLYVVTAADAIATGPHAWTPWRRTLIRDLVAKVEHVLQRGDVDAEGARRYEERVTEIRGRAGPDDDVDRFLAQMPRSYIAVVEPAVAVDHIGLLSPRPGVGEVRTSVRPGDRPGTHQLTVVAADRPGLLAHIAGALALSGMQIMSAHVFTTRDGVALDLFDVAALFNADVDEERWRRFRSDLRRALLGRVSLDARVREKRRHYPAPRTEVPVDVRVDNSVSQFSTVVEVFAPDRIGLLFELARAFQDLDLDVHIAKVATYGARVVDAFYVRDLQGRQVVDDEVIAGIAGAIERRLTS